MDLLLCIITVFFTALFIPAYYKSLQVTHQFILILNKQDESLCINHSY